MKVVISKNPASLGNAAAENAAAILASVISEKGKARIILSTGASQFELFRALKETAVDWSKVEAFHLDEYIGLPVTHKASFRKYLKERFENVLKPGRIFYVATEGNVEEDIDRLSEELLKEPIDLGFIGIGENAHIAFNDPPADFTTRKPYIIVKLNDTCKAQQVREGWFAALSDVPEKAVTMSVNRILECKRIISCVPGIVKAKAIKAALSEPVTPLVPAAKLRMHKDIALYLDIDSASLISPDNKDGIYKGMEIIFNA